MLWQTILESVHLLCYGFVLYLQRILFLFIRIARKEYVIARTYPPTRTALGRAFYLRQRSFDALKVQNHSSLLRRAATNHAQYLYVRFSRRNKIPRVAAEKVIRFRQPDYDPDQAQKLISSSMSRHLSTRNISSKSIYAFLSNLANRQTDRQTNAGNRILLPPL